MTTKANQPRLKECEQCNDKEQCTDKNLEVDCWNPDRMLDILMRNNDEVGSGLG